MYKYTYNRGMKTQIKAVTEDQIQENRRNALDTWLKKNGGARQACQRKGFGKSVESHISQMLRGYSFGSRAARGLEVKLGMPSMYLGSSQKTENKAR